MNRAGRIKRLELRYRPVCRTCGGWPGRVVVEDLDSGRTDESVPRSGCPDCGTPPKETIKIIGEETDDGV